MPALPPVTVPVNVELGGTVVRQFSAAQRVLRTVVQVAIAMAAAIPAAIALLPIPADAAAWAVGIAGGIVIVVTALQNALEGAGILRPILKAPVPAPVLELAEAIQPAELGGLHSSATTPLPPTGPAGRTTTP